MRDKWDTAAFQDHCAVIFGETSPDAVRLLDCECMCAAGLDYWARCADSLRCILAISTTRTAFSIRVEEHLRAQESFVSNVNQRLLSVNLGGVLVLGEHLRLQHIARGIHSLLVEETVLCNDILSAVAILLLDFDCYVECVVSRHLFVSVSEMLEDKLGDITASQRDVLHTRANYKAVRYREHMGYTVT